MYKFNLIDKRIFDNDTPIGVAVPRYIGGRVNMPPLSIKIVLDKELKQFLSDSYLKELRKFIKDRLMSSYARIEWL